MPGLSSLSPDEIAQLQAQAQGPLGPPQPAGPPLAVPSTAPAPVVVPDAQQTAGPIAPGPLVAPMGPTTPAQAAVNDNVAQAQARQQALAKSTAFQPASPAAGGGGIDPALLGGLPATPQVTSGGSTTVEKGIPLSQETKDLRASGMGDIRSGQALEELSLPAAQKAQHDATARVAGLQQQAADQMAADAAKTEAALAPQREAIKQAVTDYQQQKVDPAHFWKSRSTPQKIALVLGQMAGAFSAGYKTGGGHDYAADIIRAANDDDISAQKENIDNQGKAIEQMRTSYGLDAAAFATADQRRQAERVVRLEAASTQIKDEADATNDPLVRAKMLQVHGEVQAHAAQASAELDKMTANRVTSSSHYSSTTGGQPAGGAGLPTDRIVQMPDTTGPDGKVIPGGMALLDSPQAAQKYRQMAAAAARVDANTKALNDLLVNGHPHVPGTDDANKAAVLIENLKSDRLLVDQLRNSGANAESVKAIYGEGAPGLTDWHLGVRAHLANQSAQDAVRSALVEGDAVPLGGASRLAVLNGKPVVQDPSIPSLKGGK